MRIIDWLDKNPDSPVRIIRYIPAPDKIDEHGHLYCDEEGTSTVIFDSITGEGDIPFDIAFEDISTTNEDENGTIELEYVPEQCLF